MNDEPPKTIGLVKSQFGWALWNRDDFTAEQASVQYVLKSDAEAATARAEEAEAKVKALEAEMAAMRAALFEIAVIHKCKIARNALAELKGEK